MQTTAKTKKHTHTPHTCMEKQNIKAKKTNRTKITQQTKQSNMRQRVYKNTLS